MRVSLSTTTFVLLSSLACRAQASRQVPLAYNPISHTELDTDVLTKWSEMDVVDVMMLVGLGQGLDERRVLQMPGSDDLTIATKGGKLRLKKAGYQFMDVTDHLDLGARNMDRHKSFRHPASFERKFTSTTTILDDLDKAIPHMKADIAHLTSFWNRNADSAWGLMSSDWVHDHVVDISSIHTQGVSINITKFPHSFPQNTVIARISSIEPTDNNTETIILGAHQDSLNYALPFYHAPGADDDGSGSVALMQVLRSLVAHDFVPPPGVAVELHWYAGEEKGMLGSQDIAASYEREGRRVRAMFQMDMIGYTKPGTTPVIALMEDLTNGNLTSYLAALVETYASIGWKAGGCSPYCVSDHMSWTKAGYPAAFAIEALFEDISPHIHTIHDRWDGEGFDFEHMLEFVKLGISYITELSVASATSSM